jgi:carbon storage regulator
MCGKNKYLNTYDGSSDHGTAFASHRPCVTRDNTSTVNMEEAMLVLSRGNRQKIVFPTLGISMEVLQIAGNRVQIGIEAPTDIPVHRSEVAERMRREKIRPGNPR